MAKKPGDYVDILIGTMSVANTDTAPLDLTAYDVKGACLILSGGVGGAYEILGRSPANVSVTLQTAEGSPMSAIGLGCHVLPCSPSKILISPTGISSGTTQAWIVGARVK